jgi:hypothetical protein
MAVNTAFERDSVLPSYWANRIQQFLSGTDTGLRLTKKSATVVEVAPTAVDASLDLVAVAIEGRWRQNEAAIERTVSGAAGTYNVYVVAEDEDVDNSPVPYSDHTVTTFELRVSKTTPEGAGIDVVRKIGEVDWSGTAITALRQTHGAITGPMLTDGAMSGEGDIEWTRDASGGLIPQLKANSVTANEIAAEAVGASEIKDAIITDTEVAAANKDGAVGTASMRTLGTGAKQAAAGNDSRLSDERVPMDGSVTEGKIADAAASSRKLKPTFGSYRLGTGAETASLTETYSTMGAALVLTPAVASTLILIPSLTMSLLGEGHVFASISIDGGAELLPEMVVTSGTGQTMNMTNSYQVSLSAAEHKIRVRALGSLKVPAQKCNLYESSMAYFLFAS